MTTTSQFTSNSTARISEPRPTWLDRGRIPSLDGLRALAVIGVLFAHARATAGFPFQSEAAQTLIRRGAFGVDIFFVISGFLITTLLLRESERTSTISLQGFYLRRCLRILPAYFAYLLVVLILQLAKVEHLTRHDWLSALTYTVNFHDERAKVIGHIWSLSVEEHFYLFFPLSICLFKATNIARIATACIVFCNLTRWSLLAYPGAYHPLMNSLGDWTFTRIDTIAWGCLLAAHVRDDRHRRAVWDGIVRSRWLVLAIAGALLTSESVRFGRRYWTYGIAYGLEPACATTLLWFVLRSSPQQIIPRVLNYPLIAGIGVMSYSLYLWQQLFLHKGEHVVQSWPLNILCAFAAAAVSYRFIERPFLNLKDRLHQPHPAPSPSISITSRDLATPLAKNRDAIPDREKLTQDLPLTV